MKKSIHIDSTIHRTMKTYCQQRGVKMAKFLTKVIHETHSAWNPINSISISEMEHGETKSVVLNEESHRLISECCGDSIKYKSFLEYAIKHYINSRK